MTPRHQSPTSSKSGTFTTTFVLARVAALDFEGVLIEQIQQSLRLATDDDADRGIVFYETWVLDAHLTALPIDVTDFNLVGSKYFEK
jgi:hypothetical protein